LLLLLVAAFLALAGFVAGVATMWLVGPQVRQVVSLVLPGAQHSPQLDERTREERAELLWEIWDTLDRAYLHPEDIDPEKMIYGAASGMVATLGDQHTTFVEPIPASILDEDMQGSFEGIGATVELVEGRVTIVRPLPDSPAIEAGLLPGDVILAVNDVSLEGKTLLESIRVIRGPRGTMARLLIQRQGIAEPFIVAVKRAKVELPNLEAKILDGNVAYLRISEFNALSANQVRTALRDLLTSKPVGIVFDLRDNPGGYLQMAIEVASEFLPKGAVIVREQERDKPLRERTVQRVGLATEIPLVVLVNGGSASASEIVAGAIQEDGRGILVGTPTYGKGSVQLTHTLQDSSSLRVTIAKWLLPSGRNLDGDGIVPDIEAPLTPEDILAGQDPQLQRAVGYLLGED
jgi:carboxyl-terminal processing protease